MRKVLVNAMPLTVVGTGIGRYLRGLYSVLELEWENELDIAYFTGDSIVERMPKTLSPGWKEKVGQLLWKMPYPVALGGRLLQHVFIEKRFRSLVKSYDIYHEAGYFPLGDKIAGRTMMTVHDLSLLLHPEWHPKERVAYWRMFFQKKMPQVDVYCAVSEFTKQEMVRNLAIDPASIVVTPLGVDPSLFNAEDDTAARLMLKRDGVPSEYLLFVGSGDPRKRLDHVLAAHADLGRELPLVVVGWSGWSERVPEGVCCLGYVSDRLLAQLYRQAKLLLMPSAYEGFGLPVVEAMACGCPVLSSRAGALVEVGGGAVRYFDQTNSCNLYAEKIKRLARDKEELKKMSLMGQERALNFGWGNTALLTRDALMS